MIKRATYTVAFLFFLGAWIGNKGAIQAPRATDAQTGFSDKEMVDRHNHWRSEVGAPNLQWSESLAAHAQGFRPQRTLPYA